jgi:hypothetical protein
MKNKLCFGGFFIALMLNFLTATAQKNKPMADLNGWPKASLDAAKDMMKKYGNPDESTPTMLVWHNNGPWVKTVIFKDEVPHNFPMVHTDVMQQWVRLRTTEGKIDNLFKYDGSVVVERTTGLISARCDKEGANFLALNLAYDIIQGRKSVDEARKYYSNAIQEMMAGKMDPYMMKLNFGSDMKSADPDVTTIK